MEKEEDDDNNKYDREQTSVVLEKWGIRGNGEMNSSNIRNAASSYAKIQVKNKMLKWTAYGSLSFIIVFMGLMIASVVIGIKITDDFDQSKGVLVESRGKRRVIRTSDVIYNSKMNIMLKLDVVQGIKSVKFSSVSSAGKKITIKEDIVSFYYSMGRNVTLYGHNHLFKAMPDGTVEMYSSIIKNGGRIYESSKRIISSDVIVFTTNKEIEIKKKWKEIFTCEHLMKMEDGESYLLISDLECVFDSPLNPFSGTIDGNMHLLSYKMNSNSTAGLFQVIKRGSHFKNLLVYGEVVGFEACGTLAVEIDTGSKFDTTSVYGTINCYQNKSDYYDKVLVGGFSSRLHDPEKNKLDIEFMNCISQTIMYIHTLCPDHSIFGGFFALATPGSISTIFNGSLSSAYFANLAKDSNADNFGFKSDFLDLSRKKIKNENDELTYGMFPDLCQNPILREYYSKFNLTELNLPPVRNFCVNFSHQRRFENMECCNDYIDANNCILECKKDLRNKICIHDCKSSMRNVGISFKSRGIRNFSMDNVSTIYSRDLSCGKE